MKSIDTNKFDEMFFGKLDKKLAAVREKEDKLESELSGLQAGLAEAEAKLSEAGVKDDLDSYKKQFHIVSDLKIDIQAVETLIANTKKDINDIEQTAPEYWKNGIEDYKKIINPYVKQYMEKKAELFELFIQMIKAQNAITDIGKNTAAKYHIDDKKLMTAGLFGRMFAPEIEPMNGTDVQYFYQNFLEMAKGDQSKVYELQQYGEFKK